MQLIYTTDLLSGYVSDRETFWMSTGLFPQEMIIKLSKPGIVEDISIKGVKLKEVIFLGSSNNNSTWEEFGHLELNDSDGIQMGTINAREYRDKMAFLKIKILGGWNDFCAIRSVNVAPA